MTTDNSPTAHSPQLLNLSDADRYVETPKAAKITKYTQGTLNKLRVTGGGPPFIRLGGKKRGKVIYDTLDLHAWMQSRKRTSTSEIAA